MGFDFSSTTFLSARMRLGLVLFGGGSGLLLGTRFSVFTAVSF
jgi:hypothetical protein